MNDLMRVITTVNVEGGKITVPNTGVRTELVSLLTLYEFKFDRIELLSTNSLDAFGFMTWHLNINGVDWHPYINRRMANSFTDGYTVDINEHFKSADVIKVIAQLAGAAGAVDIVARLIGQYLKPTGPSFPPGMFDEATL